MSLDEHSHDAGSYGARLADHYDEIYGGVFDTDGAVDFLTDLAGGGRVLEFGVGTGRIAIPLAARALHVWGVDGSPGMLERLSEKPGGERVKTICGDFANVRARGNSTSSCCWSTPSMRWAARRSRWNALPMRQGT